MIKNYFLSQAVSGGAGLRLQKITRSLALAILFILLMAGKGWGQVAGDYRTYSTLIAGTYNWVVATNWEIYDGASWAVASVKPGAANSVYIQSGHVMALTGNEACNDLHLCNNTTSGTGSTVRGKVDVATFTLEVNGKL
ncbi:MAG: hypothetical protein WCI71_15045, partial [Bacteroidota bacterium]